MYVGVHNTIYTLSKWCPIKPICHGYLVKIDMAGLLGFVNS